MQAICDTIEEMLETELSEHLGYEAYEVKGRNSGNSGMDGMGRNCARPQGKRASRCRGIGMVTLNRRW